MMFDPSSPAVKPWQPLSIKTKRVLHTMAQAPAQACSSEVQRTFNLIKTRLVVDKGAIESWLSGTNHHSSLSVATEASY